MRLDIPDLVAIARGVHVPASEADDLRALCRFVLQACADDSVISNITAAWLHRYWLPEVPTEIHVATASLDRAARAMTRTRLRGPITSHRRKLSIDERGMCGDIPVTSPAQTWVDLGTTLRLPDLVAAGDSALRLGVTPEELRAALVRSAGRRGVRRAALALPLLDARSRSRPESHLRLAAAHPRLPVFGVNEAVFRSDGGWLAEPDLSLVAAKLALEYQGAEHADVARLRKDITRATDMRGERWLVLEYGPAQVFGRPWQIAPELIRLVGERAPHLLRPHKPSRVVT